MVTRRGRDGYRARPGIDLSSVPVHPLLAAAYPVVFLFATNIADLVSLRPLWLPLGLAVVGAVAWMLIGRLVMGEWLRGALLATLVAALFFSFGHAWFLVGEAIELRRWLIGAYAVIGLAGTWLIWRGGRWVVPMTRLLNVAFAGLVAINAFSVGDFFVHAADGAPQSSPLAVSAGDAERPDVYYVILDRYANEWTLDHLYDVDNRPFLDALRERGFYVAEDAWANYFKTAFSISSSLDMAPLDGPALKAGAIEGHEFGPINRKLRGHLAGPMTFKSLGYEYVHIGSFFAPSATNPDASVVFNYGDGLEFSVALGETTALSLLEPARPAATSRTIYNADLVRPFHAWSFDQLEASAERAGPTFVFAHFLLPHPPYVYLPDGREPTSADRDRTIEQQYADQLKHTNTLVLQAIDAIVSAPGGEDAVIIIQGDEGPFPQAFDDNERNFAWLDASEEQVRQKFGILNAVRLPGVEPGSVGLHSRSSPVNNLRVVLNALFDAKLPLFPDAINLSPDYPRAYDFVGIQRGDDGMPIMPASAGGGP